jgi:hypothetical protein
MITMRKPKLPDATENKTFKQAQFCFTNPTLVETYAQDNYS